MKETKMVCAFLEFVCCCLFQFYVLCVMRGDDMVTFIYCFGYVAANDDSNKKM